VDNKLSSKEYFSHLIREGSVLIDPDRHIWWGSHPHLLLTLYR